MPMSATTANWHWKSKGVLPWARSWFETELPTVIYTTKDVTIGVSDVSEVEGDAELGMRKSKLITIFDVRLVLNWSATHSNGAKATGSLTIPELSHEVVVDGLTDYTYDWRKNSSTDSEDAPAAPTQAELFGLVKKTLPDKLTPIFEQFPKAIIDTHGRDLVASPNASGTATPVTNAPPSSSPLGAGSANTKVSVTPGAATNEPKKVVNTSSVRAEASFMVSAEDLFEFLTSESRIPQWTRAPVQCKPEPGSAFSLFGGGVTGEFISVDRPNGFVQSWKLRSPSWPADHAGTLTTTLEQQSDSTKLTLELTGVPKGQEDEIERNLIGYYIHGLKSIGYVAFNISSKTEVVDRKEVVVPRKKRSTSSRSHKNSEGMAWWQIAGFGVVFALLAVWASLAYF